MARDQSSTLAVLTGAVVLLWMATRPYHGIVQDTRLYTLSAFRLADPARFDSDLFFQFGSQDRFTLFSYLYEPMLRLLGTEAAAMLLTIGAHALWLGGAFWLARVLVRDSMSALVAVAGLIALPSIYGAQLIFSFGEPFVTPRLFVEAVTMAVLGLTLQGRFGLAMLAVVGAAALHPIMTLPGAAVLLIYAGARNRRYWIGAVCAGAASLGLVGLGVEPFARLGVQFDPAWFETVHHSPGYVFLTRWSWADYTVLASQVALTSVLLRLLEPVGRRLMLTVLAVAVGGLGLTFVGADVLHNQLLTDLQFWRATWLLGMVSHLLTVPALAVLVRQEANTTSLFKVVVFGGVFSLLAARFLPATYIGAAFLLTLGIVFARNQGGSEDLPRRKRPLLRAASLGAAAAGIGVALAATYLAISFLLDSPTVPENKWAEPRNFVLYVLALGFIVSARIAPGIVRARPATKPLGIMALAALLLIAASTWDQRSAWARFVESSRATSDDLASFVPDNANIYWDGGLELLWLHLKHPSYYSCAQGAGVIFFRGTALAYAQRRESFRFEPVRANLCKRVGDVEPTPVSEAELRRACVREPQLDYMVLPDHLSGLPGLEWVAPVSHWDLRLLDDKPEFREVKRYFRYSCAALR